MVSIINNNSMSETYLDVAMKNDKKYINRYSRHMNPEIAYEIKIEDEYQPFFPYSPTTQYRFTNVSMYSSGSIEQSLFTADLLSSYFDSTDLNQIVITDGTSCIGGNTWAFASTFGWVHAVELDFLHFSFLQHNMSQMGLYNISYYHDNFISQIGKLRQDILFLDPPWGGVQYIQNPQVGLYSPSGMFYNVPQIIRLIPSIGEASPSVICIKLPRNYVTSTLRKQGYPFKKVYTLKTSEGLALYKLLILSKEMEKRSVHMSSFTPIRYKKMKYTKV